MQLRRAPLLAVITLLGARCLPDPGIELPVGPDPEDAAVVLAPDAATQDLPPDAAVTLPQPDADVPEVPPPDAALPVPPPDAAEPVPPPDAAAPRPDAAVPVPDAAVPRPDAAPVPPPPDAAPELNGISIDAKLLLISADGSEDVLEAIEQALDFQGTPYTVWIASQHPGELTADVLVHRTPELEHGFFQGVILTSGDLRPDDDAPSALTKAEWQTLRNYEALLGVRQVTWHTVPTADYGFGSATRQDTWITPIAASLTPAGHVVFPYLTGKLTIDGVDAFLAAAANAQTTPLLTDAAGHALIAVKTYADGRQNLALTFDGDIGRVHTRALAYGVIDWVTRGLFIGERRVFVGPQVDDVFLGNTVFTGGVYRIDGNDLRAVASWQQTVQQRPTTRGLILTLAFNGKGTEGLYSPDTLTPAARELQAQFRWVSHTWSHHDLDTADYATTTRELEENDELARQWPLDLYSSVNLMTPSHSGLANAEAMRAAHDHGIMFLISNTSRPDHDNPFPNVGIHNAFQPALFEIPRHPTEIYFDVTTPEQEAIEYRSRHTDRAYTYAQIIEKESDHLLLKVLKGDMDPWMFHQSNLRAYDGSHTLLLDLLDRILQKYDAVFNLPILTLAQDDLGERMVARTDLHYGGVSGTIVPGKSITLTAQRGATVPVTGLRVAGAEVYGSQVIAQIRVAAGTPVTIPLP